MTVGVMDLMVRLLEASRIFCDEIRLIHKFCSMFSRNLHDKHYLFCDIKIEKRAVLASKVDKWEKLGEITIL